MVERPQRPHLLLDDLESGAEDELVMERRHEGVAWTGLDLTGEKLHDRDLLECSVTGATLDDAVFSGSRLREVRLEGVEATAVRLDRCEWREVEVDSSRFGALDLYDAQLRLVHLTGCRIGYLNLRGSTLTDVVLERCHVEELDLGDAEVSRLALPETEVGMLSVQGARLADVDLRGARVDGVTAVDGLRGVTVSPEQLAELAPLLAGHLGIDVG